MFLVGGVGARGRFLTAGNFVGELDLPLSLAGAMKCCSAEETAMGLRRVPCEGVCDRGVDTDPTGESVSSSVVSIRCGSLAITRIFPAE